MCSFSREVVFNVDDLPIISEVYKEVLELVEATTEHMVEYQVCFGPTDTKHDQGDQIGRYFFAY